jgi:peptidoglycan/xylan/chitin deacetylase (PgdA/CDA1 family)
VSEHSSLTRRNLLHVGVLAGAAAALAIPLELMAGVQPDAVAKSHKVPTVSVPPPAPPAAIPSGVLAGWTDSHPQLPVHAVLPTQPAHAAGPKRVIHPPAPAWAHTWADPISRLDDFVARSPGTHYQRNAIMLTIDDGPHPVWTPKYLRLLQRYHVQATFCVIGRQVLQYPHLVKAAVHDGHHIANHTFDHPLNLPRLKPAQIHAELENTNDAIVRATGFRPRQFRAPGGVWGPAVYAEVSRQEMMPLGWDIDPRDWSLPGVTHIRSAMLASRPHDIILCHDGGGDRAQTYAALETVIPAILNRGWRFVTLPAPQSR